MNLGPDGYVVRSTHSGRRNPHGVGTVRDWWMVKARSLSACGVVGAVIPFGRSQIRVPVSLLGRRVRVKVEVLG